MRKCPWCRESKRLEWKALAPPEEHNPFEYVIQCLECGAQGPPAKAKVDAEIAWNNYKVKRR